MSVNPPHNQLGRRDVPARRDDSSESNSYCRVLLLSLSRFCSLFPSCLSTCTNHRPDVFRPNQRPCLFICSVTLLCSPSYPLLLHPSCHSIRLMSSDFSWLHENGDPRVGSLVSMIPSPIVLRTL